MSVDGGFDVKVFGPFGAMFEPFFSRTDGDRLLGAGELESRGGALVSLQLKALARTQLEGAALANRRLQAYAGLPARFSKCRSAVDVVTAQADFVAQGFNQYGEYMRRVINIWAGVLAVELEPLAHAQHDYIEFEPGASVPQAPSVERTRAGSVAGSQHRRRVA